MQRTRFRGGLLSKIAKARDAQEAFAGSCDPLWKTLMHCPGFLRLLQYSALELNESFDALVCKHLAELVEVVARSGESVCELKAC